MFGSVKLIPGVNLERTPTANEAGYSQSSLIRFMGGLAQKIGGWVKFFSLAVPGIPRDLHAWQDLNEIDRLSIGTTTALGVITNGSYQDITPQQFISNFTPLFSTTIGSPLVTIIDPNISNVTLYDSIFFNTPISVGGLILSGLFPITLIVGVTSYQITAASNATANVTNGGAVPVFTTTTASALVSVAFNNHGLSIGGVTVFPIATSGNNVMIDGAYPATSITNANNFQITAQTQATASSSFPMNGGLAELLYYIALGPPPGGVGYGLGGYGLGGYGTGVVNPAQSGTEITTTDWTSDNWGEILLACPKDGGIYYWSPSGGFINASLVSSAPPFSGGIFVSMSQQILVAWGTSITETIGVQQDPMLLAWCDVGNFFEWNPTVNTQAGNFRISIGSEIRAGIAVSNQNLIWTDLDLWAMNYVGPPLVFGFNKIGAGAGACGSHAIQQLRGDVYWMGQTNFYKYSGGGVAVIPCPVWDAVFQNLNTTFIKNVRSMPNTQFNECGWLYPSTASASGECDSYVKMNITEPGQPWDNGPMSRSAWIDQSVFGPPIAATPQGIIYQHETGNDADGQPLVWSFSTGYYRIAEGEDYAFVDQFLPDMKWGGYGQSQNAQVQFTFNVVNFSGDTPRTYGPYTVSQASQFISTRFRGGLMSITASGSDLGSFARLGYCRYRWSPAGRR